MATKCDMQVEIEDFETSLKEISEELEKEDLIVGSLILSDIVETLLIVLGSFIAEYFRGKNPQDMENEYNRLKKWVMAITEAVDKALEKGEPLVFSDTEVGNFFVTKLLDEIEKEIQKKYIKEDND